MMKELPGEKIRQNVTEQTMTDQNYDRIIMQQYKGTEEKEEKIMAEEISLAQLYQPLTDWYGSNARVLPWRQDPTPYHVWVSEIMLQQTRVEAVRPYYARFLKELPDVAALSRCPEEKLLKLWEGLGYYNRVRNMQKAAQTVMEEYGGRLPADYEKLRSLRGIGSYTAGAVASIAFGIPVPAVDGNVLRILMRVFGDDSDIARQSVKTRTEKQLLAFMQDPPMPQPGRFNQALMELGATVCLPNGAPLCDACPWNRMCRAKAENRIGELPVRTKGAKRRIEHRTVLIIRAGERVLLHRRPSRGLLAGLYEFPNVEQTLDEGEAAQTADRMGLTPLRIRRVEDAKHIFSHVEWQMTGYLIQVDPGSRRPEGMIFAEPEDTAGRYPIPSAFSAYVKYAGVFGKAEDEM